MKEKVDVTGVPETMLQTLYARAKETKKSEMSWPVETVSGKMFYLDGAHCKTTDAAAESPKMSWKYRKITQRKKNGRIF